MAKANEKMYVIGDKDNFTDGNEAGIIVSTEENLSQAVSDWLAETFTSEEDVLLYEVGRKGILPKREIQFV